jgi:hypothetical protein
VKLSNNQVEIRSEQVKSTIASVRFLKGLLLVLGLSAIFIGAIVYVFGAKTAIHWTEMIYAMFLAQPPRLNPLTVSATLDSELRFYAVFWISYGVVMVWGAWDILKRIQFVLILVVLFFFGGIGRVISLIFVGNPHPAFIVLMVIELVLPVIPGGFYLWIRFFPNFLDRN